MAVAGLGAIENKGKAFGGFSPNIVALSSWTEGHRFGWGSYRFLFLLHDSRILTIAHMASSPGQCPLAQSYSYCGRGAVP